jgi:beta-lactam-binding protein with PASTA domain
VLATVPDLVGLHLPAAHDAALDAGLLAVVVGDQCSSRHGHPDGPGYQVIGQHPEPDRRLPRGQRVHVRVRRRPTGGPDDDGSGGDGRGGLRRGNRPRPVIPSGTK